jgi:hypothetical protein
MPLLQTFGNATARAWRRYGPTSAAADYELISTTILGSSAASVTFSGLGTSAAAYKHLQIRVTARTDRTGADSDPLILRFNSDSGSNYARHGLLGYNFGGSGAVQSNAGTSQTSLFLSEAMAVSSSTTNAFGATIADVLDFSNTSKNKTVRSLAGMNAAWSSIELRSGVWFSTSAVTSITLLPLIGSNLVFGSRFSLYGLK